jgi:hypothetical protein
VFVIGTVAIFVSRMGLQAIIKYSRQSSGSALSSLVGDVISGIAIFRVYGRQHAILDRASVMVEQRGAAQFAKFVLNRW